VNRFVANGRTAQENAAFSYVSALANFRKSSSALTTGKTTQFIPYRGLYTYFRYDDKQTIMVISNTGDAAAKPRWNTYIERTNGFTRIKNIITGKISPFGELELQPKECLVGELMK
jgi:glycosidase